MVLEMTGQISHIVPVIIAVILANIVIQSLHPSLYSSLIRIKKLPYLPEPSWGQRKKYDIHVADFMERDVRCVTLSCCYRDLRNVLQTSQLKTLALVESAESMILLGSIERAQLQSLLTQQLGRPRHLQKIREWTAEEKKHLSNTGSDDNSSQQNSQEVLCQIQSEESSISSTRPVLQKPLKPALNRPSLVEQHTELSTGKSGNALKNYLCSSPDAEALENDTGGEDDMTIGEIEEWEERQLDEQVNFNNCKIDPAPFQLLELTSLHKTQFMFSLLGLDHAYVTSIGRLTGVVSLKELRKAIEGYVSVNDIRIHSPLSYFLHDDSSKNEPIELHKLLDCFKGISPPRESTPSEFEAKSH